MIPAHISILIAALALLVSAAALVFSRRDKGEARATQLQQSQKASLDRVEQSLSQRLGGIESLSNERHNANSARLTKIDGDLSQMQEALRHIPTHRDIDALQNTIGTLSSSVAKLEGALEANTRMTERMNQYLMERGHA